MSDKIFKIILRKIKNDIAHQYDDELEQSSQYRNNIVIRKKNISIHKKLKNKSVQSLNKV